MTSAQFQLPVETLEFGRVGKLFRKQILKLGKIQYGGQVLEFTPEYVEDLIKSFEAGAFDQVSFQMADAANTHTQDPERSRGEVKALIATPTGLDALIELTEEGAKVVEDNPRLGVSARIVQPLKQADGRVFGKALHHVLGTLDPRLTGMSPWQPVQLANDGSSDPVVDLTSASYEGDPSMSQTPTDPNDGQTPGATEPTDEELEAMLAKLVAEDEAAAGAAQPPATAATPALAGAALTGAQRPAVDLAADARAQAQALELAAIRNELDEAKFQKERIELLQKGVPPKMVELAAPLLRGTVVVELAGGSVDAGAVVRSVLAEAEGQIDLTGEHGALYPTQTDQGKRTEDQLYAQLVALTGGEVAAS